MDLLLAPGILEEIIQHASRAYPNEGCGLLVGRQSADRFIPITNISPSPAHYEMNPSELVTTLRNLRDTGEQLVAIYHSHPHGPATPSKTDVERAYYPEAAHLIVSLAELKRPQVAAFRIIDSAVLPVEVRVIV